MLIFAFMIVSGDDDIDSSVIKSLSSGSGAVKHSVELLNEPAGDGDKSVQCEIFCRKRGENENQINESFGVGMGESIGQLRSGSIA